MIREKIINVYIKEGRDDSPTHRLGYIEEAHHGGSIGMVAHLQL